MQATYESPLVPTGQRLRSHLAGALARLAYGLFYLAVLAGLLAVPAGLLWLLI